MVYLYSTIKRGRVRVRSARQHRLLIGRRLPHSHVYRSRTGRRYITRETSK